MIRSEIQSRTGRALLSIQNHIYGCFLFMEDIAQKTVTVEGSHVQPHGWNLDTQFWEIGMRYGFIMDAQLSKEVGAEYKAAWLAWFQEVAVKKSIEEVDALEDRLIRLLRETVPAEEAFFVHALESGELPMVWKERAVRLLVERVERVEEPASPSEPDKEPSKEPSKEAPVEQKPMAPKNLLEKHRDNPKRMFACTRRQRMVQGRKTILSTTRRNVH